ncbi:hypothetical protein ACWGI8_27405 [Streptomyces sp. NPDC054841]
MGAGGRSGRCASCRPDAEPVGGADLDDCVDGESEHLAATHSGAGEDLDRQPDERIGIAPGGCQQLGGRGVVEETRQRLVRDREVAVEHQLAGRSVDGVPLVQTAEESSELAQPVADGVPVERPAAGGWPLQQPLPVTFDVPPLELGDTRHGGVLDGHQKSELPQRQLGVLHGARPQRPGGLLQVMLHGGRHRGRNA